MKPDTKSKLDALILWHKVSRKEFDQETLDWLASVALRLIEATDLKDSNQRRAETVKAVGLAGRRPHLGAEAARVIVNEVAPKLAAADRARVTRVMVGAMTNNTPGTRGEISEEALRKRIFRARKALKSKT